ncbi:cation diffusion facilitator family transporter [Candidatus Poriferisocius sp.]|uniref:cation diffusion facilitator family transporter n=1 Tax=Candidatus Poriferisocius sp. TaxID=3101276 RepID=UPI003B523C10
MASQGSRTAVIAALLANTAIAVAKFVATAITGSAAMLAEAIHSVADAGNQAILLWGMSASKRPGGATYPFGRGKEVYFWSFIVAVMLFIGGAVFSVQHGVSALQHPHEVQNTGISVAVLVGALAFEGSSWFVAVREFNRARGSRALWRTLRETKDAPLLVILFEDSAAMAGLLLALAGIVTTYYTQDPMWDALASILIGILLAGVAFFLAFEIKGLLIGEAAGRRDRANIRSRVLAHPNVTAVNRLLTMAMSPDEMLVNLDIVILRGLSGDQVHQTVGEVEQAIRTAFPSAANIFIETDVAS